MFPLILSSLLFLILLPEAQADAQSVVHHQQPTLLERGTESVLEFELREAGDDQVSEALLFMRAPDRSSYSQTETRYENRRAAFPVQIDDPAMTSVEYYIVIRFTDGSEITWPDIHQDDRPVRVDIVDPDDGEEKQLFPSISQTDRVEAVILSPRPDEVLSPDDLLIAIALYYDRDGLTENGDSLFQLWINGRDMTAEAEFSPYLIKYTPEELPDGDQQLLVTLRRDDEILEVIRHSFRVAGGQAVAYSSTVPGETGRAGGPAESGTRESNPPSGSIELGMRNQHIGGLGSDTRTGQLRFSGREGDVWYSMSGYLTSREYRRFQPQNRFQAEMRYGEMVHLQAGDVYPHLSSLTVSGRRVRGLSTRLSLLDEQLEVDVVTGQLNRGIPLSYEPIRAEIEQIQDGITDTLYTLQLNDGGMGSYRRTLTGGQISYGQGDRFRVSIHGMKIQDDTTSVNAVLDYTDVLNRYPGLTGNLSSADRQTLEQNPDYLIVNGGTPPPAGGNAAAGIGVSYSADDQRLTFTNESGVSLYNPEIRGGTLSQRQAGELGLILNPDTENFYNRLSWLIIINEHMNTPPYRYQENEEGMATLTPRLPTSALASDSRIDLDYYDHQLQIRYRWIGPGYRSLANSTIRRDAAGFNVSDRFRLLDNRLYITLGYENLRDNLSGDRTATIRTTSYRTSASWYPVSPKLPRLSLTGRYSLRDNSIQQFNPWIAEVDPDLVNRALENYSITAGDTLQAPSAIHRASTSVSGSATQNVEFLEMNHQVVLSYGYSRTDDRYFSYGNSNSRNLSLRLTSRIQEFSMPLRTHLGFSIVNSESMSGLSGVNIRGFDLGAETFLLDDNLTVRTDLAFTGNRFRSLPLKVVEPAGRPDPYYAPADENEQDIRHTNAYILRLHSQYDISSSHAIQADVNLTNVIDPLQNQGTIPNDRVFQMRYLFRF